MEGTVTAEPWQQVNSWSFSNPIQRADISAVQFSLSGFLSTVGTTNIREVPGWLF